MRRMFSGCSSFTSLNLSIFNTNNVIAMREMFDALNEICDIITNVQNLLKLIMDL